jgi:hypothetical protein
VQQRGVQLHVVPGGDREGGLFDYLYLTEDPTVTRDTLQAKVRQVECIDQWRGTVWVGYAYPEVEWEDTLAY